jgi:hypothetical protein
MTFIEGMEDIASTNLAKMFFMAAGTIMMLLPLRILFINNHFFYTLKSLINQNFNRKELISFAIFTVLTKITLLFLNYSILYSVIIFGEKWLGKPSKAANLNYYITYDVISYLLMAAIGFLFFSFALYFRISYIKEIQNTVTQRIKHKAQSRDMIQYFLIILSICIYLISGYQVPETFIILFVVIFSSYMLMTTFNRAFKLYDKNLIRNKAGFASLLMTIPFISIFYLMSLQVHDTSIPFSERVGNVLMLEAFHTDYTAKEANAFLLESKKSDYDELLPLLSNKIKFDELLQTANSTSKTIKLARYFKTYKLKEEKVLALINTFDKHKVANQLSFAYDSRLSSFLSEQKVSKEVVDGLLKSKSTLKQLAGTIMARKNMEQEDYVTLVNTWHSKVSPDVINHKFVKREIASFNKNKENKKEENKKGTEE